MKNERNWEKEFKELTDDFTTKAWDLFEHMDELEVSSPYNELLDKTSSELYEMLTFFGLRYPIKNMDAFITHSGRFVLSKEKMKDIESVLQRTMFALEDARDEIGYAIEADKKSALRIKESLDENYGYVKEHFEEIYDINNSTTIKRCEKCGRELCPTADIKMCRVCTLEENGEDVSHLRRFQERFREKQEFIRPSEAIIKNLDTCIGLEGREFTEEYIEEYPREIVDDFESQKEFKETMNTFIKNIWPDMNCESEVDLITGTYEDLGVTKTLSKD